MNTDSSKTKLIVGLGNPGEKYTNTRHNAGFWLVENLAMAYRSSFKSEKNFLGDVAKIYIADNPVYLLCPNTFMNNSGDAVLAIMKFYKITVDSILIAHDEIDLPVGTIKFKQGGGNGGHNGLKSIIAKLNSNQFLRLRIGVSRPSNDQAVDRYVLSKPNVDDRITIDRLIDKAIEVIPRALDLTMRSDAIKDLHSYKLSL